jgi:hypothetical protein
MHMRGDFFYSRLVCERFIYFNCSALHARMNARFLSSGVSCFCFICVRHQHFSYKGVAAVLVRYNIVCLYYIHSYTSSI